MARILFVLVSALTFVVAHAADTAAKKPIKEKLKYIAKDSTEAYLSFHYFVDFQTQVGNVEEAAKRAIRAQLQHLYGPMGEAEMLAVPKNKHTVSNIKIEPRGDGRNSFRANYFYRGAIALQQGDDASYTVVLPRNPSLIYKASTNRAGHNPCTDEHYQSQGDFWYFWNPEKSSDCRRLLKAGKHYDVLTASA